MIKRIWESVKNILNNKVIKKIFKYAGNIIIGFLIALVVLSVYGNIQAKGRSWVAPSVGPFRWLTVLSGSMKPVFNPGDLIIDKKITANELKVGDIVTYMYGDNFLSTHRIVDVNKDNKGQPVFKTKGDNNNAVDEQVVSSNAIVGKYLFRIPFIGYILLKLKGLPGIIAIWILFIYVAGMEVYRNVKESKNKKKELIEEKPQDQNQEEPIV